MSCRSVCDPSASLAVNIINTPDQGVIQLLVDAWTDVSVDEQMDAFMGAFMAVHGRPPISAEKPISIWTYNVHGHVQKSSWMCP